MSGLYNLKTPSDLFLKAQKDSESFWDNPNDYDLFNLLATLNHLRDWICPGKHESYKHKSTSEYTPEEKLHSQLFHNENYKIINALCNNAKHFNDSGIGEKTEVSIGFEVGVNCCGDRLSQRNYWVEGVDLRDVIGKVFCIYKDYFANSCEI